MKTLVEIGEPDYLEMRALEMLNDIIVLQKRSHILQQDYHESVNIVIGLLALARIKRGAVSKKARTPREKDSESDRSDVETKGMDC